MGGKRGTVEERFWAKVNKEGLLRPGMKTRCWEWTAGTACGVGYGILATQTGKAPVLAHRFSWELHKGPIPKGLQVCHKCDFPGCVRPTHFFLGTMSENMKDKVRKGRHYETFKLRPELIKKGQDHGNAKLTEKDVLEIRSLYGSGTWLQAELGDRYGVRPNVVSRIVNRKAWRHI